MFSQLVHPKCIEVSGRHSSGVLSYTYSRNVHGLSCIMHPEGQSPWKLFALDQKRCGYLVECQVHTFFSSHYQGLQISSLILKEY